jgi:integrase
MSGVRAPHLQRRDGVYYLRLRVPDALRSLVGKTEIVKSLRTASLRDARPRSALLTALVMEAFEVIKTSEMTANDAKRLIQSCFVQAIAEQEEQPRFVPQTNDWEEEFGEQRGMAEDRIAALHSQSVAEKYDPDVLNRVRRLLTKNGFSQQDIPEPRFMDLANGMARILIEQQRLFLARLEDRFATYTPSDPLFVQGHQNHAGAAVAGNNAGKFLGPNLGEAVETYLSANEKVWRYRTHVARVWQLGYLVQFLGAERPISSIKPDDIRRYRDAVISLRANHGKAKVQSFSEKQTDSLKGRIKPKTADYIFQPVKAFFSWAISVEGLIETNPASAIKLVVGQQKKGERSRRPFEPDEIRTLFMWPTFTGCKSAGRRDLPGAAIIRDGKYWLPILGYYSGCRLGELVQLAIEDVQEADGVPYLDINEKVLLGADQKSVKSVAGMRKVPLHPDLVELGFLDFVAKRAKQDKANVRLFKEIKFGADKQASTVYSKTFARLMHNAGLTDSRLVFHSWRHGVEDALRDAEVQPYIIDAIVGHADNSIGSKYGKGVSLAVMAEAVAKMKLPVRLPEILAVGE